MAATKSARNTSRSHHAQSCIVLEEQAKLRHASLKGQRRRLLVDSDEELQVLAEIEGLTSARLLAERGRNPHLDPRELAWRRRNRDLRICGDTHVNAALTYTRTGGNRFNSEDRGAWYRDRMSRWQMHPTPDSQLDHEPHPHRSLLVTRFLATSRVPARHQNGGDQHHGLLASRMEGAPHVDPRPAYRPRQRNRHQHRHANSLILGPSSDGQMANHTDNIQPATIRIPLTIPDHPSLTATMEVGYGLRLGPQ